MNLAVDLGNTSAKAGLFVDGELQNSYYNLSESALIDLIQTQKPTHIILSSVRKDIEILSENIRKFSNLIILNSSTPAPYQNLYATPQTLGVDRIAAAIGAKTQFLDKPCLVIDLGTCITYDLIDAENNFLGGNIAPGLQMRLKAMHHFTAKLPLLEFTDNQPITLTGDSTQQAMFNGAIQGIRFEIEGYRQAYQQIYPSLTTILCGGDTIFFESKLKPLIFAVPNLTLIGLNRILQYNVAKN